MRIARTFILVAVAAAVLAVGAQPLLAAVGGGGDAEPKVTGFVRGELALDSSRQGAILSAPNLVPGDSASGSITITNSGSLAARLSLRSETTGSRLLASRLRLVVAKASTGARVYAGPLSRFQGYELGRFAAGEAQTYRFEVELPSAVGNEAQGLAAEARFTWTATAV